MRQLLLIAVLAGCFACEPAPAPSPKTTPKTATTMAEPTIPDSLLRHTVFFAFNDDSSPEQIETVRRAFSALPDKIGEIHDYEWGTNNSPEGLNRGFTHAFIVTFLSEADRAAYLPHPAHLAFVEVLQPQLKDVFVVDFWARND